MKLVLRIALCCSLAVGVGIAQRGGGGGGMRGGGGGGFRGGGGGAFAEAAAVWSAAVGAVAEAV